MRNTVTPPRRQSPRARLRQAQPTSPCSVLRPLREPHGALAGQHARLDRNAAQPDHAFRQGHRLGAEVGDAVPAARGARSAARRGYRSAPTPAPRRSAAGGGSAAPRGRARASTPGGRTGPPPPSARSPPAGAARRGCRRNRTSGPRRSTAAAPGSRRGPSWCSGCAARSGPATPAPAGRRPRAARVPHPGRGRPSRAARASACVAARARRSPVISSASGSAPSLISHSSRSTSVGRP